METLELVFNIEPMAVQSARFFRYGKGIRSFQPKKVTDFKKAIGFMALEQLRIDFEPFECPVSIEADFVFSPLKSMRKKELERIRSGEIVYKTTKPDLTDNLMKATVDSLTKIVWNDDALICEVKSRKRYGEKPMILLKVTPLQTSSVQAVQDGSLL